ncbi:hypothetical protein GLI01_33650 [Gluconacetobacter liquefaciens]|uniref:Uncharacterized protein n=1 Tax=Gluconacetobacter liquefaciens TaxID=89584 RepID=A0A370GAU1_GLULI|nr:hypothetical protein [Gluconacetobacter liquefaciens]MBB2185395.1 hypothetical protein [Gluconacetobacter liquefaciens]RDI40841.1 hypothetical protein C7453_101640 [Gluconacetobacter liquefaciens]GBR01202.1 hypothetical protein AA0522_1503 [Gluconacetobacter liquefaciens NRIC 0522]GEB39330.1 hypothetical protein GLI01_33650 [Gluconacetobacter liquefaciens]
MTCVIVGETDGIAPFQARFPQARHLSATEQPVWHAEPERLWVQSEEQVGTVPFARLVVVGEAALLCAALGCQMGRAGPLTDANHQTSRRGIFFLPGRPDEAAVERIAITIAHDLPPFVEREPPGPVGAVARLEPLAVAMVLGQPETTARDAELLGQVALTGPIAFCAPVKLAALAAIGAERPAPYPIQMDQEGA